MNNYRPVSNIPFTSKVLEKMAVKQLLKHLTRDGLLEEYQSAYGAAHSTETALLREHNDLASQCHGQESGSCLCHAGLSGCL